MRRFVYVLMLSLALTACQSGGADTFPSHSRIIAPPGMFPGMADERGVASRIVSYNFTYKQDALKKDLPEMIRTLAYFEWLINDLQGPPSPLSGQKLEKLLQARDELREALSTGPDYPANDYVNELWSLAKLLENADVNGTASPLEAARRDLAAETRTSIDALLASLTRHPSMSEAQTAPLEKNEPES